MYYKEAFLTDMKLNEYKKQIFDKILFNSRVDYFVDLLAQLSCALSIYKNAFSSLRFLREDKMDSAEKDIQLIYNQLDEFFNEGFFQELTEEQAIEISDEYQHVVEEMITISMTIKSDASYQKFTDLIDYYKNVINPKFDILNENINIYNNKANKEGWKYKLKTYDETKICFKQKYSLI